MIALYGPDGKVLDAVLFGPQTRDVSQGRFPDGSPNLRFFTNATPRASNFSPTPNTVPSLPQYADRAIDEGTLLRLAFTATDADIPAQTLTYSLEAGSPEGASIDSSSGLFSWRPTVSEASTTYLLTVNVRDDGSPPLSASQTFRVSVLPLLRITDILQVEDRIEIRWAAVPGRHYRVEQKADLMDETWIDLGATLTDSGDTASATVLIESVNQRVYRVVHVD